MVEVELFQRLARRKAGGPDTAFATVGFAGRHFTLQTCREELLVAPGLGAGPLSEALDGLTQGRRFQCPGQICQLSGHVPAAGGGLGAITPPARRRPNRVS